MSSEGINRRGAFPTIAGAICFTALLLEEKAAAADPGWQIRFTKVHDLLKLRVGGPTGRLIEFPNRGKGNEYTWTFKDPAGETQDIRTFVGEEVKITLYAEILKDTEQGFGDQRCELDVLYKGKLVENGKWVFEDRDDKEFKRETPRAQRPARVSAEQAG